MMSSFFSMLSRAVAALANVLPYSVRRLLARALIRLATAGRLVFWFIRELFSYDIDKREKLSSQLLFALGLIFAVFVTWAAFAEFDQVITANAKVYPFSRLQLIEHYEGGRIEKILVKQGDLVDEGDLLVKLSPLQSAGELNIQRDTLASLTIRQARLLAEYERRPGFQVDPKIRAASPASYAQELASFAERGAQRRAELSAKMAEVESAKARLRAAEVGLKSTSEEYESMRQLVAKGLEPRLSLIRAEKALGDAKASQATAQQDISRTEANLKALQQEQQMAVLAELTKVRADLTSARETIVVAADKADRTELRSPIRGVVNRVLVSTEGGTVKPGETVVEIVPSGTTIVVEASIQPSDIGFISIGQPASVKITAYDFSIFGSLSGKVTVVAADTTTDEKGNQFYVAKIELDRDYIETKGRQKLRIIPGMVAQVDIVAGKRTALEYVFSPLTKVMQESFREK